SSDLSVRPFSYRYIDFAVLASLGMIDLAKSRYRRLKIRVLIILTQDPEFWRITAVSGESVPPLSRRAFSGFSAPSARHQIDVRPWIEQRVGRGLDPLDARNGVENNPLLLGGIVRGNGCQTDLSERYQLTALRPADGRIIRDVAILCQLYLDAKPHRLLGHSGPDLI